MAEGNVEVKVLSRGFVKPVSSTRSEQSFIVTPNDHMCALSLPGKRILFYKKPDCGVFTYSELVLRLQESLAEALVAYYPFSGRLRKRESDGKVEACRFDEGARFVEAEVDISLEALGSDFQNREWFWNLAPDVEATSVVQPWTPDTPTLSVQVTRFVCGGYSIGLTYSHQVSDGNSFWDFWKTWSQIACKNPSIQWPDFSRHVLQPAPGNGSYSPSPHFLASYMYQNWAERLQAQELAAAKQSKRPYTVMRTFTFSRESLSRLKQLAAPPQQKEASSFTTYEVLCGHCWQRVTLARKVPASNLTKIMVTTGTRGKIRSLPSTYFGNALQLNYTASVTAQELTSNPLCLAASLIHEAKVIFNEAKMRGAINDFAKHQDDNNLILSKNGPDDITVTSSPYFPAYEVDYGWGKPERVRAPMGCAPEGIVLLLPGPTQGSVDVMLTLTPDNMRDIEQDPKFMPC